MAKANGYALIVGVSQFQGGLNPLGGVRRDFDRMKARLSELEPRTLFDMEATAARIIEELYARAKGGKINGVEVKAAKGGDLFVFYIASHGAQRADVPGGDEPHDQVLCAYDKDIVDDQLGELWPQFAPGVRIVVITDTCHSGTVTRVAKDIKRAGTREVGLRDATAIASESKQRDVKQAPKPGLARSQHLSIGIKHGKPLSQRERTRGITAANEDENSPDGQKASLLHFAGCRDLEVSGENSLGGYFTSGLLQGLSQGAESYTKMFNVAVAGVKGDSNGKQVPQLTAFGPDKLLFANQKPFQVDVQWPPLQFPS